jgi:hypothetical protein
MESNKERAVEKNQLKMNWYGLFDVGSLEVEARAFRRLVRKYLGYRLPAMHLNVPPKLLEALLLDDDEFQLEQQKRQVSWDHLSDLFNSVMDEFISSHGSAIRSVVHAYPQPCIWKVVEMDGHAVWDVLTLGNPDWGRLISAAGYLLLAAAQYMRYEADGYEAVLGLIDYATVAVHSKLARFIRDEGGWATFAYAMEIHMKKEKNNTCAASRGDGWSPQVLSVVANGAAICICVAAVLFILKNVYNT